MALTIKGNSVLSIIGSSPINSAITWAEKSFVSLFRMKASNAFSESKGTRPYVNTRGYLISKKELFSLDDGLALAQSGYMFQFNPQQFTDSKVSNFETRSYAGLPYVDYIWTGGGERQISFQLFIDDTPASHTRTFNADTYSKLADEIKVQQEKTKEKFLSKKWFKGAAETALSSIGISLTEEPKALEWKSYGAYSHTRIHERGTLDAVERVTQYLYPQAEWKYGRTKRPIPKFSTGGIVNVEQFRPPAVVVFSFGDNYYLEGIMRSANVTHTLFDADLTPIRSTIDVTLGIIDSEAITDMRLINYPTGGGE